MEIHEILYKALAGLLTSRNREPKTSLTSRFAHPTPKSLKRVVAISPKSRIRPVDNALSLASQPLHRCRAAFAGAAAGRSPAPRSPAPRSPAPRSRAFAADPTLCAVRAAERPHCRRHWSLATARRPALRRRPRRPPSTPAAPPPSRWSDLRRCKPPRCRTATLAALPAGVADHLGASVTRCRPGPPLIAVPTAQPR
ncbi:hypothetical protein Syun_006961 [Stephania yunnanensis]|uniref:Uncharacterized protein n=1 Tax=Stephania yunnanensis TaxID=152371 RepID=A0AAP0L074_9MAGN